MDTSGVSREAFSRSCGEAVALIEKTLAPVEKEVNVTVVGHTHIDNAWLWRICHTHEKCARSFSTVNRLMERYPSTCFCTPSPSSMSTSAKITPSSTR